MEERKALLEEIQRGEESVAELSRKYGVSRKTIYKWKQRVAREGEAGLVDRSRAPHQQALAVSEAKRKLILAVRQAHATWGARKIRHYLRNQNGQEAWPAASTMGELLQREGLVKTRPRGRRLPPNASPLEHAQAPNQVWCTDFKGWFLLGNGERCNPLTVQDAYSRYVLRVRDMPKTDTAPVRAVFETLFRTKGLPGAMRTDNGPPFATQAPAGLSRLSMSWIRLGIRHERIDPGCPQQNGRLERFHGVLLADVAASPAYDRHGQQKRFDDYEEEYDFVRPHEALGGATPGSLWVPSARSYPARIAEIVYPDECLIRRISQKGDLKFGGERTFLSEVLTGETVGLRPVDDGLFEVYWANVLLGWFDGRSHCFERVRRPVRRRGSGHGVAHDA